MFKNPFSFNGRIRRTEFGISYIIYFALYLVILYVGKAEPSAAYIFIGFIPLVWFLWAQGAKRCHDLDKSGWWQIVPFYFLWLIFQAGQEGSNEYGEDPKSDAYGESFKKRGYYDPENYTDPFPLPDNASHSGREEPEKPGGIKYRLTATPCIN